MPQGITTWSGLENRLLLIMDMAFRDALNQIEKIYISHINIDVYSKSHRNYYVAGTKIPTMGLRDSVASKITKKTKYTLTGGIYHDEGRMILDPDNFIHGSNYSTQGNDVRSVLPKIINDGLSGDIFGNGWWQEPRPFISNTLEELQANGTVKKIFLQVFRGMGIKAI